MGVDVGAWLSGLGLGQYEQVFRDNDIDADLLPALTMNDLCALGVASLGHRKRLLSAIALLGKGLPVPPGARRGGGGRDVAWIAVERPRQSRLHS
jgi:hypothetical protein